MTAIALALAAILGCPPDLATLTAEEIERTDGADVELLARALVWQRHESDFGRGLKGRRWDARAYGNLQIRDRPDLEHDARGSVNAWVGMLESYSKYCGGSRSAGLRALSSGHCDWAGKLVSSREAEADAALYWAGASLVTESPWGP